MGYALSILMCALQTWLYTKLWDSFFTRRFSGKAFWAYWVIWTAAIVLRPLGPSLVCCNNGLCLLFFYFSTARKGMAALFGYDADGVCI